MSKPRKLLTPSVLRELARLTDLGVPVASAMRTLGLEDIITRPTVVMLLRAYSERHDGPVDRNVTITNSLFPTWLNDDSGGAPVQEQPEDYNYNGYFPQGYWECKT